MSLSSSIRRFALLVVVIAGSGCASWQPYQGDVVDARRGERPERARVLLESGGTVELEHPTVVDSMVVGRNAGSDGYGVAIPVSSIAAVEVGRSRNWMPALIAGAVVAAPILADMMARSFADLLWPLGRPVGR